jgi:DNA-directed RNA polymerase specialized sigma24 family protein
VAPPPIHAPPEPSLADTTESREHSERRADAAHCARLPALIAALSSPDREIVLLRVVAGLSIPDVVAALGVTPAAVRLTQQEALDALQPAATANAPPHQPVESGWCCCHTPGPSTRTPDLATVAQEGSQA